MAIIQSQTRSGQRRGIPYRPEIDGLRAVAVLPVVLFHAGFALFEGGYVGVDVFFVISGYLITSLILDDKANGTFSIVGFYERRARRILPALYLVVLVSVVPAWLWMLPKEFVDFGESLVGVSLFVSNVVFWQESGYFAQSTEIVPLLHTWSLAVEEQFYLFFPPFVAVVLLLGRRSLLAATIAAGLLSLALAEWASGEEPRANFFLAPTRAWELMVGAILAQSIRWRSRTVEGKGLIATAGTAIGVGLILAAVLLFDESTAFPGLAALLPTGGAALCVLYAGPGNPLGRLLANRILVAVGLISYSLYLWHQPLFAFARIRLAGDVSGWVYLVLIGASFGLAWLSWRWIERPFRRREIVTRGWVALSGVATTLAVLAIGWSIMASQGAPSRLGASAAQFMESSTVAVSPEACRYLRAVDQPPECLLGVDGRVPTVALWGDSFADALHRAVGDALAQNGLAGVRFVQHGCPSIAGLQTRPRTPRPAGECRQQNDAVLDSLVSATDIDTVILTSGYAAIWGSAEGADPWVLPVESSGTTNGRLDGIQSAMGDTIDRLVGSGKHVVIVGAHAPYADIDGVEIARRIQLGMLDKIPSFSMGRGEFELRVEAVNHYLLTLAERSQGVVQVVFPVDVLCGAEICEFQREGDLLLADGSHFSVAGAALMIDLLSEALREGER